MTLTENNLFDSATKRNIDLWLTGNFDSDTKRKVKELLNSNPQEAADAFYTNLSFGTGGLRGVMGVGTNRMNAYTVRAASQGLANYINNQTKPGEHPSILIGYDSRQHSRYFAEEAAKTFAGNHIKVYLFKELRPVPLVSFGCRYKKCSAAVMITASHNPPEYNGYKVYWSDGAQILPPHDQGIIDEVNKITALDQVKTSPLNDPLIVLIDDEVDRAYLETIKKLENYPQVNANEGKQLAIVYSNLHGTGITMVPEALAEWGFTNVRFVDKQKVLDGHFPTVKYPNPEEHSALKLGIDTLIETNADILMATDPDCDRVGVVVSHKGGIVFLTGNQVACILLDHLCKALVDQNRMPKKPAVVKTIVTTELFKVIAEAYQVACLDVLTGFKYIAEKIRQWEEDPNGYTFIFGGEESYGYLLGTHSRDKDAVISCCLIAEAALQAKKEGKTLYDRLQEIYKKYGVYIEKLVSVDFEESKEGREKMKKAMVNLRNEAPRQILGTPIESVEDYQSGIKTDLATGKTEKLTLPKSNVLRYHLKDNTQIVVRPSGTEPKIKLYDGVTVQKVTDLSENLEHCQVLSDEYLKMMKNNLLEA